MIHRLLQSELLRHSTSFGIILLTGPRQSGKTTLCKSAKRYSEEFTKGLDYINNLYPTQCKGRTVVFDGLTELTSNKVSYINFRTLFA